MSIIRTFGELAQEFMELEVEAFELDLAINGSKYAIGVNEFVKFFGADSKYFHHLAKLNYELSMEFDVYVDAFKIEKYDIMFDSLDHFLQKKGIKEYIELEKNSAEYQLLAKHFLTAKMDSLKHKKETTKGKSFKYSFDNKIIQTEVLAPIKDGPEERNSTYNTRVIINEIATRMRKKYPTTAKYILADDIATELKDKHKISKSARTILRSYSTHF